MVVSMQAHCAESPVIFSDDGAQSSFTVASGLLLNSSCSNRACWELIPVQADLILAMSCELYADSKRLTASFKRALSSSARGGGAGGADATATETCCVLACPSFPIATSVYVVLADGLTDCCPFELTGPTS